MSSDMAVPVRTFLWCHIGDDKHRKTLDDHLMGLRRAKRVTTVHHGQVSVRSSLLQIVEDAEVVVLFVTARLLAQIGNGSAEAGAYDAVLRSNAAGKLRLLPVLVEHVSLRSTGLEGLSCIPPYQGAPRPVVAWRRRSDAWYEVAKNVEKVADSIYNERVAAPVRPELTSGAAGSRVSADVLDELRDLVGRMELMMQTKISHGERCPKPRSPMGGLTARGRYRLLDRPWAGRGMETWLAIDELDGARVLFHTLNSRAAVRTDVVNRIRDMGNLDHPGIARVLEVEGWDSDREQWYFVTDPSAVTSLERLVLEGRQLAKRSKARTKLSLEATLAFVIRLGEALEHAHRREVQHGAVDPRNIWCGDDGTLTLNGFDPLVGLEIESVIAPKSPYLAPEIRGKSKQRDFDPRIDVYALAMTMVYMLRRDELPKEAVSSPHKVIDALSVDAALKRVLVRATQSDPKKRQQTIAELITGLARAYVENRPEPLLSFVDIPAGEITLGNAGDPLSRPHELPPRTARVSRFAMAKYAVTQKLYRDVMGTNPSAEPHDDRHPVTRVRFRDAAELCNRLSKLEGLTPPYEIEDDKVRWDVTADGYRLPTEAEWEYAARGTDGRRFPWGDDDVSNQVCWNGPGNDQTEGARQEPCPVDAYQQGASPFGVIQMAGNVWEWCWDLYEPYSAKRDGLVDPIGPSVGHTIPDGDDALSYRIMRGGAWNQRKLQWMRATSRSADAEGVEHPDVGLRLVRGAREARR